MPGPVSDAYDPEFSTADNRHDVHRAVEEVRDIIGKTLGLELKAIVGVTHGDEGEVISLRVSERQRRLMRFAMNRALESL